MPHYIEMYLTLFRETTSAIQTLQLAQQQTEELYLEDETADHLNVLAANKDGEEQPPQA